MSIRVIRLGAWCDLVGEDVSDNDVGVAVDQVSLRVSFRVAEFAVVTDGRRVTLHDDRGFDSLVRQSDRTVPADPWRHLTLEQLEMSVLTAVLPDDAEDSGEERPWEWLSELLRGHGVEVAPEELRHLPYECSATGCGRGSPVRKPREHVATNRGRVDAAIPSQFGTSSLPSA